MGQRKFLLIAAIYALTLVGCGGGGGDGRTVNNPLLKYEGTYYFCEDNSQRTITLTAVGPDSLRFNVEENIYSGNNCSGSILATYRISNVMAAYRSQTTALMPPFTIFPYSDKVDEVILMSAGATSQLTGPGVQGNCVNYSYATPTGQRSGKNCFPLTIPNETAIGAIYLTNDTKHIALFIRENGVLSVSEVWSRDASFNYNSLSGGNNNGTVNNPATGGTQSGGNNNGTVNNPLLKYEGTYYSCEDNERVTVTATALGTDSLSFNLKEEIHAGNNCSGSILGTYRLSNVTVTYKNQTTATMPPVTVLPYSDKVDEVTISTAGATNQLTGSGVQGNCVRYSYATPTGQRTGESCYELTIPNEAITGALYLTSDNKYLVQLSRENGVLNADGIQSRDPSFNYNMLVRD